MAKLKRIEIIISNSPFRTYADYYQDYYYGIDNRGNYSRLTKKDNKKD